MRSNRVGRGRGQALVELLVGLVALIPLFFGMAWVAKVQDMQAATHQAARGMAFECAQLGSACPVLLAQPAARDTLRQRYFSLASEAGAPPTPPALWHDRRGAPLLERFDDVALQLSRQHFNSPLAFARGQEAQSLPGAVRLLSELAGPGRFGLDIQGGLYRAQVQTPIARRSALSDWLTDLSALPIQARSQLAILTDTWSASRPYGAMADSVETRVRAGSRLPNALEASLEMAWWPARGLLIGADWLGLESRGSDLRWHQIDVDLVPPDRLEGRPIGR